jgi:hypothetical protein
LSINPNNRPNISDCLLHSALEIQLKVYLSKKLGNDITAINILKSRYSLLIFKFNRKYIIEVKNRENQKVERKELKNLKTFSMREPLLRSFSKLGQNNTNNKNYIDSNDEDVFNIKNSMKKIHNDLKPRYLASRLKNSFHPIQNTPQPITISIGKTLHEDSNHKKNFPVLSNQERYNTSFLIKKQILENKNENNHPSRENDTDNEAENNNNNNHNINISRINNTPHFENVKVIKYLKIIKVFFINFINIIFLKPKPYQMDFKNNEIKVNSYVKLLKNRNEQHGGNQRRSKSTIGL